MRDQAVVYDLSPTGALRVSINLGNPVLAQGTADDIRQAVATTKDRSAATVQWLRTLVEEFKSSGFVARALARSGQDASVAPPG